MNWIKTSERLPTETGWYIVAKTTLGCFYGVRPVFMDLDELSNDEAKQYIVLQMKNVSHWMPLPKPPKEGG